MSKHRLFVPLIAAGVVVAACAAPPAPQAPQQPAAAPTEAAPAPAAQPAGDGPQVGGVDRRFDGVTLRAAFIGGGQYEKMYESITKAMASKLTRS
ncbi:MAG: hypothetical protein K6U78_11420 [Anaerolineae bacterium]|nr:hypothetical protein [Anaerolineae bacterium]